VAEQRGAVLTDVVCVTANQMASRVGDELAILDLDRSVYYGLDAVGARVWELLQTPTALSAVLSAVVEEFEVDREVASVDLLALVDELVDKDLVEFRPSHVG
jgi:hypothetical protein